MEDEVSSGNHEASGSAAYISAMGNMGNRKLTTTTNKEKIRTAKISVTREYVEFDFDF